MKLSEEQSLKTIFVRRLMEQILLGELAVGQRLPSERVIAEEQNISRNVVRVGLAELTALGFLRVEARRGTFVNDYVRDGNMLMLDAICDADIPIPSRVLRSLLDFRMTVLRQSARMCAHCRTEEDIVRMQAVLEEQSALDNRQNEAFTRLDFQFHKEIYLTSGNAIYPMIHNSIETLHQMMAFKFYEALTDKAEIKGYHRAICKAIQEKEPEQAGVYTYKALLLGNQVMAELQYLPQNGSPQF